MKLNKIGTCACGCDKVSPELNGLTIKYHCRNCGQFLAELVDHAEV